MSWLLHIPLSMLTEEVMEHKRDFPQSVIVRKMKTDILVLIVCKARERDAVLKV